jgi:hypothetical protein
LDETENQDVTEEEVFKDFEEYLPPIHYFQVWINNVEDDEDYVDENDDMEQYQYSDWMELEEAKTSVVDEFNKVINDITNKYDFKVVVRIDHYDGSDYNLVYEKTINPKPPKPIKNAMKKN